jgi:hypothetical protein
VDWAGFEERHTGSHYATRAPAPKPVIDRTNISGVFYIDLQWTSTIRRPMDRKDMAA